MNRSKKLYVIPLIAATVTALLLPADIFGAVDIAQREKIKQDIEILEGVLDQLIIQDSPFLFSGSDQVQGIYLDGFGVMFDLESSGLLSLADVINRSLRTIPRISISSDDDNQLIINVDKDAEDKQEKTDEKAEIEKSLKQTENLIYEFFLTYASTVKSLPADERICVNIRNSNGYLVGEIDDLEVPSQLRACAKISDLGNYRRGKISESKLRSQIQIDRIYGKDENRDLDILGRIIDRSLGLKTGLRFIGWDGNTSGMYLDGFGALFFSQLSVYNGFEHIITRKAADLERKVRQYEIKVRRTEAQLGDREELIYSGADSAAAKNRPGSSRRIVHYGDENDTSEVSLNFDFDLNFNFDKDLQPTEREIDSVLNDITDKIINVLGQYGATMRSVKKDESILVAVDITNPLWSNTGNMLYIKAKKADIERYARDAITFEKFRKSVKVWKD